jgi:hypothetical protein
MVGNGLVFGLAKPMRAKGFGHRNGHWQQCRERVTSPYPDN